MTINHNLVNKKTKSWGVRAIQTRHQCFIWAVFQQGRRTNPWDLVYLYILARTEWSNSEVLRIYMKDDRGKKKLWKGESRGGYCKHPGPVRQNPPQAEWCSPDPLEDSLCSAGGGVRKAQLWAVRLLTDPIWGKELFNLKPSNGDFPGAPVAKTLHSQYRGPRVDS